MTRTVKWLWTGARIALGAGLIAWIWRRILTESGTLDWRELAPNPLLLAAGHFALFAAYLLGIARWRLLLRAIGIRLTYGRAFTLFFIGHFFNAFMLGSTGGDLVKAYRAASENKGRRPEAAATVFLDRVLGLAVLSVLAVSMLLLRAAEFFSPAFRPYTLPLAALLAGLTTAAVLLFTWNVRKSWLWRIVRPRLPLPERGRRLADRALGAARAVGTSPRILAQAVGLSLFVHLFSIGACLLFAAAIHAGLAIREAAPLFLLVGALGSVPLTPGGLGVREGGAVLLFGALGVPHLTAFLLGFLPYLSTLVWSLFGGLLDLADAIRRRRHPPANSLDARAR